MTDVVFTETQEQQPTEEENLFQEETDKVSQEWLKAAEEFLDQLKYDTLTNIIDYQNSNQVPHKHPTTHELALYMDRSYSAIQPRTSQLKDKMLITEAGKRPCTCPKCVEARQNGKPEISVTTWQIRQVTQ